jgi:hypothetical protein
MAPTAALLVVLPGAPASSEPRLPVDCCDLTGTYKVRFTVKLDPANHNAVIRLSSGTIIVVRLGSGRYEIRGNRSEIIRGTAARLDCGLPLAVGTGTVAGFPGVDGRYKEVVVSGDNIEGLLELGIGGELPTGQPVCYEFTGERDPAVPDNDAEPNLDFNVRFTVRITTSVPVRASHLLERIDDDTLVVGDYVLTGDGTGGFTPTQRLPISQDQTPLSVAPARFNDDALPDIAYVSTNEQAGDSWMMAFRQNSLGTFELTASVDLGTDSASVSTGDFNGDSFDDVVGFNRLGEIEVLRNLGNATFGSDTRSMGVNFVTSAPKGADIDGDGDLDFVTVSRTNPNEFEVGALFGDGGGGFTLSQEPSQLLVCDGDVDPAQIDARLADFNRDGLPDVAIAVAGGQQCPNPRSTVTVFLNRPAMPGTFDALPPFEIPDGQIEGLVTLSVLNSSCGSTPTLVANGQLFFGIGNGEFVDSGSNIFQIGQALAGVTTGDVTGDGVHEIVGVYDEDDEGYPFIKILALGDLAPRPTITGVSIAGKTLVVEGTGFVAGTKILVDGVEYKTKADRANPSTTLFSKKALKKISPGQRVLVQVRTPEGVLSEGVAFTR